MTLAGEAKRERGGRARTTEVGVISVPTYHVITFRKPRYVQIMPATKTTFREQPGMYILYMYVYCIKFRFPIFLWKRDDFKANGKILNQGIERNRGMKTFFHMGLWELAFKFYVQF